MDSHHLNAFIAVADTGSFSSAAEAIHLTQPAVSKRIAALEAQLDAPLFDRIGRQVHLTESGRALLPRARRILMDMEDARRALNALSDRIGGRLSIGTSHHIGLHRLPPVLRRYTRAYPDVQLDIRFMDSEQAHEAVIHGDLELGVVTLAPGTTDPHLISECLWPDPLVFCCHPRHPLVGRDTLDLAALCRHPAVLPGAATYTGQIVTEQFRQAGLTLNVSMNTNYLETLKMLSSVGLGWTVLPETMLDRELVRLPVDAPVHRELGTVVHRNRSLSNAARALQALLRQSGRNANPA